jgi:hypothetical protein
MMALEELVVMTDLEEEDGPHGGRVIVLDSTSPKSTMGHFEAQQDKAQELRDCLHHPNRVDLWELRQLALSPGGLLLPALRQLAWPLLTGLSGSSNLDGNSVDNPGLEDSVKKDLSSVVWSVEDLVRASKSGKESFWYASQKRHAMERLSDAPAMVSSPSSSSDTSEGPVSQEETVDGSTVVTKETYSFSENDKALIAKVLNQSLEDQIHGNYPPMLSNLAALLLINMDLSTTASSQLLSQLAAYNLQAAFGGASLAEILSICIDKLHLKAKANTHFSAEHAATWFSGIEASDFNVQTASRLVDAFLVSHPLFPVYFAAAVPEGESWTMENVESWIAVGLDYMYVLETRFAAFA